MSKTSASAQGGPRKLEQFSRKRRKSLGAKLMPLRWHERLQFERFPIHEFIRRAAITRMGAGDAVLDAGSGRLPEQYLREEILATGADLTTLDLFAGDGVDVVGDVAALPFDDSTFDFVLCTQVLEHVPDPDAVCRELFRVIRPGGIAFITAPQSAWMHNLPYHFFHFTRIGLTGTLEKAGFQVESINAQGGHFITLAIHLHFTARVLTEHFSKNRFSKVVATPVIWSCRLVFGVFFKFLALGLDRWIPYDGNTQGWNAVAVRIK